MLTDADGKDYALVCSRYPQAKAAKLEREQAAAEEPEALEQPSITWLCLRAAVALKPLMAARLIFASGTISSFPLFAAELGLGDLSGLSYVSTPHHSSIGRQLLPLAVCSGKDDAGRAQLLKFTYNSTYAERPGQASSPRGGAGVLSPPLFDALGNSLLAILKETPGGALLFFSSKTLIASALERWDKSGHLAKMRDLLSLNGTRPPCFNWESPGLSPARAAAMMAAYRAAAADETGPSSSALLMAVLRGKVSEGTDFSDAACRVAIVIGVPLPPFDTVEMRLKREYQDLHFPGPLTNGNAYYNNAGIVCASQAIGRVIRHAGDYGAAILVDERYSQTSGGGGRGVRDLLPKYTHSLLQTVGGVGDGTSVPLGPALREHFTRCRAAAAAAAPKKEGSTGAAAAAGPAAAAAPKKEEPAEAAGAAAGAAAEAAMED